MFFLERPLGPKIAATEMLLRRTAAEVGKDVPFREILAHTDRRVVHAKGRKQLVL